MKLDKIINALYDEINVHKDELTKLDSAIGDGDHGVNLERGLRAVKEQVKEIKSLELAEALLMIGRILVMKIGGASGPLFGTLALTLGKELKDKEITLANFAEAFNQAVLAVKLRGKAELGQKTMLDVLLPVAKHLQKKPDKWQEVAKIANQAVLAGKGLQAKRGRASFLGERSIGHIDPGSQSMALIINLICLHIK